MDTPLSQRFQRFLFPLITAVLFLVSIFAIGHMLDEITLEKIVSELSRLSYQQISLALLCTIASYWVLSGYDWMALRYLGRQLPYMTVVLATFCSCAISYTVGVNLLSGGSVRYRIYVGAGLSVGDVVRITLFGMIAFSVGTSVVAAMALCLQPDIIAKFTGIPSALLWNIGFFTLSACIAFLALTFWKRTPIKIARWKVRLPSFQITLSQLIVSIVDMIFAGGCLYILLSEPHIPFVGFLIVYSLSFIAGMVSHVPGGLGVFDGMMLLAFKEVLPAESLAAALVVYRIVYYLIPLILATAILAIREFRGRSSDIDIKVES